MFTGQAAIDRATKYLDSEQYKAYQKGQKEINDLQKQADAVNDAFKKSQEERAKSNNKINY